MLAKQKEKVRARWLNKQMLGSNIATIRLSLKLQPVSIPWTVEGSIVTNQSSYSIKASGTTAGRTRRRGKPLHVRIWTGRRRRGMATHGSLVSVGTRAVCSMA